MVISDGCMGLFDEWYSGLCLVPGALSHRLAEPISNGRSHILFISININTLNKIDLFANALERTTDYDVSFSVDKTVVFCLGLSIILKILENLKLFVLPSYRTVALYWVLTVTEFDSFNDHIRERAKVKNITEWCRKATPTWFGHLKIQEDQV